MQFRTSLQIFLIIAIILPSAQVLGQPADDLDSSKVIKDISESIVRIGRYDGHKETMASVGFILDKNGDIVAPLRAIIGADSVAVHYMNGETSWLLSVSSWDVVGNLARFSVTKTYTKRDFLECSNILPAAGEKVLLAELRPGGKIAYIELTANNLLEDPLYGKVITFVDSPANIHSFGPLTNSRSKIIGFLNILRPVEDSILYAASFELVHNEKSSVKIWGAIARDSMAKAQAGEELKDYYLKPLCPSMVYIFRINTRALVSLPSFTIAQVNNIPMGWGLMLNSRGDFMASAEDFRGINDEVAIGNNLIFKYYNIDFKGIPADSLDRNVTYEVKKAESAAIGSDYVIMSSKMPSEEFDCPPLSMQIPRINDSVAIIQNPLGEKPKILDGQLKGIQIDPILGKVFRIITAEGLEQGKGIVLDREGKLLGFIMSVRIPGQDCLFAFSALQSSFFREASGNSIASISGEAEKIETENPDLTFGRNFIWLGDLDRAARLFNAAYKENPKSSEVALYLGFCKLEKGEADSAAVLFTNAIKHDKDCMAAYAYLAKCYFMCGLTEEAFKICKKAEKRNSRNALPVYTMAEIYMQMGDMDSAQKELEKLQKIDPLLAQKLLNSMQN